MCCRCVVSRPIRRQRHCWTISTTQIPSSQSESGEMGFRPLLLSAMLLVYEDVVVASASSSSSVAAAGGFDFAVTGKPVMFSR